MTHFDTWPRRNMMKEDEIKSNSGVKYTSSSNVLAASEVSMALKTNRQAADNYFDINNHKEEDEYTTADTECSTDICTKNSIDSEDDFIQSHPQVATFPIQLMDLIEKETVDDEAAAINGQKALEWLPTGDKFIIRDRLTMENCVLPKYFNNKCKFMSFVRKLYRWGFRQVEKDNLDVMIFFHSKFSRGDKKKCLAMRSIVKKPSTVSIMGISHPPPNIRQAYGGVGAFPNAGDTMFKHLLQSNQLAMYHSDSSMLSGVGYGRFAFNMERGANPGVSTTAPGLVMQRQMLQSDALNSGSDLMHQKPRCNMMSLAFNNIAVQGYTAMAADFNAAAGQSSAVMSMNSILSPSAKEEIMMASLILKEHPALDNWQALQLAKRRLNGTSAIIN